MRAVSYASTESMSPSGPSAGGVPSGTRHTKASRSARPLDLGPSRFPSVKLAEAEGRLRPGDYPHISRARSGRQYRADGCLRWHWQMRTVTAASLPSKESPETWGLGAVSAGHGWRAGAGSNLRPSAFQKWHRPCSRCPSRGQTVVDVCPCEPLERGVVVNVVVRWSSPLALRGQASGAEPVATVPKADLGGRSGLRGHGHTAAGQGTRGGCPGHPGK
jgi:hypothetical protein